MIETDEIISRAASLTDDEIRLAIQAVQKKADSHLDAVDTLTDILRQRHTQRLTDKIIGAITASFV